MNRLISSLYRKTVSTLPRNKLFDDFVALHLFHRAHKRAPKSVEGGLNDALFHIKVSNELRNPLRVFVSDKEFLKLYVKAKVGDQFNVPTLAVLQSMEEVRNYAFPENCVIKPTHMSGPVIFRRKGSAVDLDKINAWFNTNYYHFGREANYEHLKPKVIVEPFIFGKDNVEDYKILCVKGRPRVIQVDLDRYGNHTRNLYTADWSMLPITSTHPIGKGIARPGNLEAMLELASQLSSDFNFMRVDVYTNDKEIVVGELTNCHGNAEERYVPEGAEAILSRELFGEAGFSRATFDAAPRKSEASHSAAIRDQIAA